MTRPQFTIRDLTHTESVALLERQNVGRLAHAFRGRVDVVPVSYVHHEGWLYGRTSLGPKLVTLAHNHWVAFEVDEIRGPFDWTSVVVRGSFHPIDPTESEPERERFDQALEVLRSRYPETFTEDDFAPHRTVLFRIHMDEITGRQGRLEAPEGTR
ncbi:MAG TPA: pyridoxamine 5'-phosphate oxidase family protein [Gemmatimonadaceae bacterium]|nr:pyridoxamine 5'-phosphate oxidase family protein [Gemmatimonadaceae bacterium]